MHRLSRRLRSWLIYWLLIDLLSRLCVINRLLSHLRVVNRLLSRLCVINGLLICRLLIDRLLLLINRLLLLIYGLLVTGLLIDGLLISLLFGCRSIYWLLSYTSMRRLRINWLLSRGSRSSSIYRLSYRLIINWLRSSRSINRLRGNSCCRYCRSNYSRCSINWLSSSLSYICRLNNLCLNFVTRISDIKIKVAAALSLVFHRQCNFTLVGVVDEILDLDMAFCYFSIRKGFFIHNKNLNHPVSHLCFINLKFKSLVPHRVLSTATVGLTLPLLVPHFKFHVRILFAHKLNIPCKFCIF
mmetsp:Transcript_13321/g.19930  ORF Transcript_13321/g.19930 Transcript_13321/m.19930 type:complete len:299 (-) Transcript_13321:143-1039(-)